jgi:tetratricopeptide (TPR) repeat protein
MGKALEADVLDKYLLDDALDSFNQAAKIAEGKDFETEAIAEVEIGKVFYKCLKDLPRARKHLYNALRLANMLDYKNVTGEDWFKRASVYMKEIRETMERAESNIDQADRD